MTNVGNMKTTYWFSFKVKLLIIFFIFFFTGSLYSQESIFSEGEELNYLVYYGFIKLGEVKMKVTGKQSVNGTSVYTATSEMKSFKGIPFVNLNSSYYSEMVWNGNELFTIRFKATDHKEDGAVINTEYVFNYDSNFVHVRKLNNGKTEKDENIKFNPNIKFQDGLSLFYRARLNSFREETYQVPVFMNEAETSVNYYFSTTRDEISVSLFDDDINCIRCNGVANFEGIFGLTGEFVGWFSDDNARVPLKSQLNVVIGNITLELDSYKRKGWSPK